MLSESIVGRDLRDVFLDIVGEDIKGIALIGPDGFLIDYVGDLSSREIGLSSIFNLIIPRTVKDINEKNLSAMNYLLDESSRLDKFYLNVFSFKLGERTFMGIYIDEFLLIASVRDEANIEDVYRQLIKVIYTFFEYISEIAGKKMPWLLQMPALEVPQEALKTTEIEKIPLIERKRENLQMFLLKLREIIFDIKKDLIEKGDWQTTYNDLLTLKKHFDELENIDKNLVNNPVIKAIRNWIDKTVNRVKMIIELKGNSIIDEERKTGLRRSLSKAMEEIRKVITREIEK